MKITNFEQAKRRMDELSSGLVELRQFLDFAHSSISAVNLLKGDQDAVNKPEPQVKSNGAGQSWADRVMQVFTAYKKPMFQKEAMTHFDTLGLPRPADDKAFYRGISGAIAYLTKRKGLLVKTEDGYTLKQ